MTGALSPDKIEEFATRLHANFLQHPSRESLPISVVPAAASWGALDADYRSICEVAAQQFDLHVNYQADAQQFVRVQAR